MLRMLVLAAVIACAVGASIPSGLIRVPNRIVGGENVDIVDFPYQLSLQIYGSHFCGASIIGNKYALTAAHCTDGQSVNRLSVRAGSTYRGSGGYVQSVEKIFQHPNYDAVTINFDLSVLQFKDPFPFDSGIQPIGLPSAGTTLQTGVILTISGWGLLSQGGSSPIILQAVDVAIVSAGDCQNRYGTITNKMICAAMPGKDACQGDSGGPMAGHGTLFGITSWGAGCADSRYPGVYASVASMRPFITLYTGI